MGSIKELSEMTQEEQMKTPLGHLFQAITPLCNNRGISDPQKITDIVIETMKWLDERTYGTKENGTVSTSKNS